MQAAEKGPEQRAIEQSYARLPAASREVLAGVQRAAEDLARMIDEFNARGRAAEEQGA